MKGEKLTLDSERLLRRIDLLAEIGATPEGGVRRLALTDEDKAGREQVIRWMLDMGLQVQIDRIGNIFGIRAGTSKLAPVMTGSHIDTVSNGGKLDGSLGVLCGLEIAQILNDLSMETKRSFVVAAFTNEEGARFQPDMMGSLVYAGGMQLNKALNSQDKKGIVLGKELERTGYAGDMECGAIIPSAFVELHIEQGPILEKEAVTLAAVENLQGISWTQVTFTGQSNHAGTTPMSLRKDAGYCAAALGVFVHDLAKDIGGGQVGTVGVIDLKPDVINVVAGSALVTVDLRNADNETLLQAEQRLETFLEKLSTEEAVSYETKTLARFNPVNFDQKLVKLIEAKAAEAGHSCKRMTSGAGHDAQMMSRICPSAMIFTPSINGISHNPAEATNPEDLTAGANVLFQAIIELLA
jgi:N-carbamoyl-L-amino-acid hydrolase